MIHLAVGEPLPAVEHADETGLLAVGGNLGPARLLSAYRSGIFPWPLLGSGAPMLWFSPDPRFVLYPNELHCSRSLEKTIRQGRYRVSINTQFDRVVRECGRTPRRGQRGTWITQGMAEAYGQLHRLGFAHSVEVWGKRETRGPLQAGADELVGGLYGLALGRVFFGESMYSIATDASKVGFVTLVRSLSKVGFALIDCQQDTAHLARFGARAIPRSQFVSEVVRFVDEDPTANWQRTLLQREIASLSDTGRPRYSAG